MTHTLVFDIGGSTLRAGRWDRRLGVLVESARADSPFQGSPRDADEVVPTLVEALGRLGSRVFAGEPAPTAVGVAFPGPVDGTGRVRIAPTLWRDGPPDSVDLASAINAALWTAPVTVVNDLTAAGYRYVESASDFCIVTVSSGVGNKLFLGGRPVLGPQHRGGELGHWCVDTRPDAPQCECGGRGHVGAISSGRGALTEWKRVLREEPRRLEGSLLERVSPDAADANERLAEAFRQDDPFARGVVEVGARALGKALALLHVSVGVESFVLVGGWARALGPPYLALLARAAAEHEWGPAEAWGDRIAAGADDDESGLIGMARAIESIENERLG